MPLLEHLGVDSYVECLDAASQASILPCLPRLSSAALYRYLVGVPDAVRGQLRDIYIAFTETRSLLNELRTVGGYLSLQSLRINSLHCTGIVPEGSVELGGLRVLYLGLSGSRSGPFFMHAITTPKLERLAIRLFYGDMTKKDTATMLDSVFRLNPPLRELRLQGISVSDVELHKALCNLPLLEVFVMLDVMTSDKLCDALSEPRRRGGWICARLTHLCIAVATYGHKYCVTRLGMEKLALARSHAADVETLRHVRLDASELCCVGAAWAWDSEEHGEDDASSDPDSTTSSEGQSYDSLFENGIRTSTTVLSWWQVDVSPYFNIDLDD